MLPKHTERDGGENTRRHGPADGGFAEHETDEGDRRNVGDDAEVKLSGKDGRDIYVNGVPRKQESERYPKENGQRHGKSPRDEHSSDVGVKRRMGDDRHQGRTCGNRGTAVAYIDARQNGAARKKRIHAHGVRHRHADNAQCGCGAK